MKLTFLAPLLIGTTLLLTTCSTKSSDDSPQDPLVVKITNGYVRGFPSQSVKNKTFYNFIGIPFAKPPTGSLRFKPPQPAENWSGVFNATKNGNMCPQSSINKTVVGNEDCLNVYLYTPQLPSSATKKLPILAFIHGGAFALGHPFLYGPQRFMDHDVILVLISYRLGALGFLSTGDSISPGNYGLMDQVLCLKWVQQNANAFGGDPNRVTLFGESAGAGSAMYLTLSPDAKGLFNGVIAQSGTAKTKRAMKKNPKLQATELAKALNCPINTSNSMVDCMRKSSVERIVTATKIVQANESLYAYPFIPTVDGKFLTEDPLILLSSGNFSKVPTIIGTNRDEAYFINLVAPGKLVNFNERWLNNTLPEFLRNLTECDENIQEVIQATRDKYFGSIDINNQTAALDAALDIFSDKVFKAPADLTTRLLINNEVPAYLYSFEHTRANATKVGHGDELFYLFYIPLLPFNNDDQVVSNFLIGAWVHFAYHQKPPASWTLANGTKNLDYMQIRNNSFTMQHGLRTSYMKFWNLEIPTITASEK